MSYPEQSEFDRLRQLLEQAGEGAGGVDEDELVQLLHEAAAAALQHAHRIFPPRSAELDDVADGFVYAFQLGRLLGERRPGQRAHGGRPGPGLGQAGQQPSRPYPPAYAYADDDAGAQAPGRSPFDVGRAAAAHGDPPFAPGARGYPTGPDQGEPSPFGPGAGRFAGPEQGEPSPFGAQPGYPGGPEQGEPSPFGTQPGYPAGPEQGEPSPFGPGAGRFGGALGDQAPQGYPGEPPFGAQPGYQGGPGQGLAGGPMAPDAGQGPGGLPRRPPRPSQPPAHADEQRGPAGSGDPSTDPGSVWSPEPLTGDRLNTGPVGGFPLARAGGFSGADPWTDPRGVVPGDLGPSRPEPLGEPAPPPQGAEPAGRDWPAANGAAANLTNLMPPSMLNAQQPSEHLPIFEAVRSDWFAKVGDVPAGRGNGLPAARRPAPPEPPPPTRAGLPRRVPMTNLAPELPAMPPPPGPADNGTLTPWSARPPGEIGSLLSRYRRGLEQGRYESDQRRDDEPPEDDQRDQGAASSPP